MIGKIVNGEKITDIPVAMPLQYPLLINESVAKELGIKIPEKLLENNL